MLVPCLHNHPSPFVHFVSLYRVIIQLSDYIVVASDSDVQLPARNSHRTYSAWDSCKSRKWTPRGRPVVGLVAALWRLHSATGSKFIPKAAAVAGRERREGSLGGTEGDHKVSEL